jgi:hypothetical protein
MPRPRSKEELINLSRLNYDKLLSYIDALPPEAQQAEFPPGTMNRNVRDVLAHLHQWHLLFLDWYHVGMQGDKPDMPAKGYSWKTLPDLNRKIWEKYLDSDLSDVRSMLDESFAGMRRIMDKHTEEELFEKKRYAWTGSTSLAAYLISATSSHYDWALKLIRKAKK